MVNPAPAQHSSGGSNVLKNPLVGVLLVVAAFGLLFWNEKRVDVSQLAATSQAILADEVSSDTSLQGQFVSVSGPLTSTETLSDGDYLKPGPYLALERTVEMYAWHESKDEAKNTYNYNEIWISNPVDSRYFNNPVGHENPVMIVQALTKKVLGAKVGAYNIDMASAKLPSLQSLSLSNDNIVALPNVRIDSGERLFIGRGTSYTPQIGDLRISYKVLPANSLATVFGALSGQRIATYTDSNKNEVYELVLGDRTQALGRLQSQEQMMTWVARVVGFLLMWGGLIALLQKFMANVTPGKARLIGLVIAALLTVGTVFIAAA